MPKYYFHVRRGQMTVLDREGLELADIEEATQHAAKLGREIAATQAQKGIPPSGGMIIIEQGWRTVLELPFESLDP
jgi:hypothetical protein